VQTINSLSLHCPVAAVEWPRQIERENMSRSFQEKKCFDLRIAVWNPLNCRAGPSEGVLHLVNVVH